MPAWFTWTFLLIVTGGLITILFVIARRVPRHLHGRLAVLMVLLCVLGAGSFPISNPHGTRYPHGTDADPHAQMLLQIPGLAIAIVLAMAVAILAQRRIGERWEVRIWAVISTGLVILAPLSADLHADPPTPSMAAFVTLVLTGLVLSGMLILCRRSLKAGKESRTWPMLALALWPFCFILGLAIYALTT